MNYNNKSYSVDWDWNKYHILINYQQLSDDIVKVVEFIKHLVVLFVIKHTDCWVKKAHPTHLCIAAVLKQLCRHLSTLFMSNCTICHWCCICQKKSEFDWQGPRVSLSSFSTFQMFKKKKKLDPPPGRLICGWKIYQRSLRDVVSVSVETLPPRDPIFLIGSNYPPVSIAAFQWSHLLHGPSVRGSVVADY